MSLVPIPAVPPPPADQTAVNTYSEAYVQRLRLELEQVREHEAMLIQERTDSDSWTALSEAKAAVRSAAQQVIQLSSELEQARRDLANEPKRKEIFELGARAHSAEQQLETNRVHTEALERKVAEQSGTIHALDVAKAELASEREGLIQRAQLLETELSDVRITLAQTEAAKGVVLRELEAANTALATKVTDVALLERVRAIIAGPGNDSDKYMDVEQLLRLGSVAG